MGSCENSVIVDELRRVSISGQHLCSEMSRPFVDSKMDLACARNTCPEFDLVSDYDSGCLSHGETTQTCTVNGDGSVEHEDVDVLGLDNLLTDSSGLGGCLDERRSVIAVREKESGGECLQEGTSVGGGCLGESCSDIDVREKESGGECPQEGTSVSRDGSVGEREAGDVSLLENSLENDSWHSAGCFNDNQNDIVVCEKESGGVSLQEGTSVSRERSGSKDETVDVVGLDNLMKNCSADNHSDVDVREKEGSGDCLQEGSCVSRYGLIGDYEAVDVLLENLLKDDSGHSGGSLDVNHDDVDVHETESNGECLLEGTSFSRDVLGGEYEGRDVLALDNSLKNDSAVSGDHLDENHGYVDIHEKENGGECLQDDISVRRDGFVSENESVGTFPLKNLSKNASRVSGVCLGENYNDFGVHEKESDGECLQEGSYGDITHICTINGDGLAGDHKNLNVLASENLVKNNSGVSGGCSDENQSDFYACNAESYGDCLQEGTSGGEDDLRNPIVGSEIHSEIMTIADLPINSVRLDEQKDEKGFCCLFAEDIIEAREDKGDVLAKVIDDLCEQEPLSHDRENLKLAPKYDVLCNTFEKEQNYEIVGDTSLGNITGKNVAPVGLEADTCNGISDPLQHGEISLEVSHSGEEVGNYDNEKDKNNCSGLSVERVTKAVGMESNVDTSNQVLLSTSLENVHKLGSARTQPQQYEQMDEKCDGCPSSEGATEFVEDKNDATVDTKVEVGTQIMAEKNSCTDRSGYLKSCQPLGVVDDGLSKTLDVVPDELGNSSHGSGQIYGRGNDNEGVNCVYEAKCSDITSSSRQRTSRRSRSNCKTQTKKAKSKCKKTAEALYPNGVVNITFKVRKKRSRLQKSGRSSAWGLLGNVTQLFEHSNGLEVIHVPNQGPKRKGGQKSRKQNKNEGNKRSQSCKRKSVASNTKIRLKVKVGKGVNQTTLNVIVPEVVDNSALPSAISCAYGTELCKVSPKVATGEVDDCQKGEVSMHFKCLSSNEEKVIFCPDASVRDAQVVNNDLDTNIVREKSAEDVGGDYFGIHPNVLVEASEVTESRCKDPGTSPDSEVINSIPDAHVDSRLHDDLHATDTSPKDLVVPGDLISSKRGKKKNKVSNTADNSPLPVKINKAKPLKQYGRKQNGSNGICPGKSLIFSIGAKASSNSSIDKEPSVVEPLLSSMETALGVSGGALKVENGVEAKTHCNLDNGIGLSKSQKSKNFLSSKTKGRKLSKSKSQGSDSEIKRVNSHSKRETQRSSVGKKKANKKSAGDQVACKVESHAEAEYHMVDDKPQPNTGENIASTYASNLDVLPAVLGEHYLPPRNAWVRCDSCHKWRRIPTELADYIEENQCSWTCKDNVDKAFADCSTPQEKSNAEINAELEISDASGEEDASGTRLNYKGLECRRPRDLRETPTCISIRTNQFLHRSRKTQTIDEIMVCHCKPPSDGQLGCRDDCLNRMLNIECVQSACPCGDLCSNQQFQKRKYAKLGKFQCGKKGYGLKLLEDITKGKFLTEYVGEVLDMPAYEARQKEYALKGHKHFYFMTLNGSEVIDACIKGNKGRFINHSCEPNCRTEKWMVNGEICIGLFALRDIKKGEEVTFDYNYVRVFGAAAKKCYCHSPQCRGYLGGDPLNGDVIIQSDSDEEYPEPMMLPENGDARESLNKKVCKTSSGVIKKIYDGALDHIDEKEKQTPALVRSDISRGKQDLMNHSVSPLSHVHDALELDRKGMLTSSVQPLEISQRLDVSGEPISTFQPESSMGEETMEKSPSSSEILDLAPLVKVPSKSSSDGVDSKRKSKSDTGDGQWLSSKAHPKVKTSRSSSSVKKEKIKSDRPSTPSTSKVQLAANKSQLLYVKPKKVIEGSFGNNFEAVEEKLNELLDADGGISKRKDATKGYLKLLLLTAASGGSANGEAIQRNRDLSMILDALLKTRSRVVLIDIINKNGLRMLHNIMKQYRRDFKKIPILRKLLKVLEYLAAREILTSEHINGGPPCRGMESFKESILSLTEHEDRQVHQIARNFRDRWIPKNPRKFGFADRDDNKTEFPRSSNFNRYHAKQNNWCDHYGRPGEANDYVEQSTPARDAGIREGSSASCVGVSPTSGTKTRKRKSRWDQPAEINSNFISLQHKEQKFESKPFESTVDHQDKLNREESNSTGSLNDRCRLDKGGIAHYERETVLEDVPPGFSSTLEPPPGSSVAASMVFHSKINTVIGYPQERFISRLPVSYGIPLSIMQQFGTPHAETAGSWVIAPGMPFHPFPPLPPYPRGEKDPSPSDDVNRLSVNQPAEEAQLDSRLPAASNLNDCTPSTTGDQPHAEIPCTNNHYTSKRGRDSYDLGRRYFKQQKWNNTKVGPSWHWRRNRWGCVGNSRDGTSSASIGNVTNEHRSTYCSEDFSCTVEKAGNYSSQHPDHPSKH